MTHSLLPLQILLDEGTPVAVAEAFTCNGHSVLYHQDVLSPGAKDQLVAFTALKNQAILIAVDRDMKQLSKRFGNPVDGGKFQKLHLIQVCCNEVMAAKRIAHAMSFIEHEWFISCQKAARRLWVEIGTHRLVSHR